MEAGEAGPTSELLAPPPPPPPPGSSKRSGKRARDGPLLFGAQLFRHDGKEEPGDAAPHGAAEAIAAVPWEPPEKPPPPPTAVQVDRGKLYCSLCSCVLTPPIYQVGFPCFLWLLASLALAPISISISTRQISSISNGCRPRLGVLVVASSARWGIWRAAAAA